MLEGRGGDYHDKATDMARLRVRAETLDDVVKRVVLRFNHKSSAIEYACDVDTTIPLWSRWAIQHIQHAILIRAIYFCSFSHFLRGPQGV